MGVCFTLREELHTFLDLSPFSPLADACTGVISARADESADARAAASVLLPYGRGAVRADALFAVCPCSAQGLVFRGDLRLGANLGQGLAAGTIRAEGNVGPNLGRAMTGGALFVSGDAGQNAFDAMQNGFGVVLGAARDGACRRMRRGAVVLAGAGGKLGEEMRGGTLVLNALLPQGANGAETTVGKGMDRGTIVLPAGETPLPGFAGAAQTSLPFLRLLFRLLAERGAPVEQSAGERAFTRYVGDAAALNKGEIFIPAGRGA